jgi:hypothetical protein
MDLRIGTGFESIIVGAIRIGRMLDIIGLVRVLQIHETLEAV